MSRYDAGMVSAAYYHNWTEKLFRYYESTLNFDSLLLAPMILKGNFTNYYITGLLVNLRSDNL